MKRIEQRSQGLEVRNPDRTRLISLPFTLDLQSIDGSKRPRTQGNQERKDNKVSIKMARDLETDTEHRRPCNKSCWSLFAVGLLACLGYY